MPMAGLPVDPVPPAKPPAWRRVVEVVLGLGLAVGLLVWGLPHFAKTSWHAVFEVLHGIPAVTAVSLLGLMLCGLWFYTFTLTGSLPGLRHTKALIVNLCGSSVGNLLPGGGAAGLAATYTVCRSWGFARRDISTSAIVTGVWNVLARVALPVIALIALFAGSSDLPAAVRDAAVAAALGGLGLLAAFVAVLASERAAQRIGAGIDRLLRPLWRRLARHRGPVRLDALVTDLRARIIGVVRHGWLSMTFGLAGYFGVYFVLFWFCLDSVGVHTFFGRLFAAYAVGRLLTAVGVTPGGIGVTETATAALLVGWGIDPAQATAGVVLFSVYTQLMEVPLGALGWLIWTVSPKQAPAGQGDGPPRPARADGHGQGLSAPGASPAGSAPRRRPRRPG